MPVSSNRTGFQPEHEYLRPSVACAGTSLADNSALPEAYALTLHFNSSHLAVGSSAAQAVQAESVMQLRAQQTTSRVLFHSKGLTYTRITLVRGT